MDEGFVETTEQDVDCDDGDEEQEVEGIHGFCERTSCSLKVRADGLGQRIVSQSIYFLGYLSHGGAGLAVE